MIVTTYDGPSVTARRTGNCPTCNKPATRSLTFSATVSPFNKTADGRPKTWAEVHKDVKAKAGAWDPKPEVFEHEACAAKRLAPPVAEPEPISEEALVQAARMRDVMRAVIERTERLNLPLGHVEIGHGWRSTDSMRVQLGIVSPGHFIAWVRSFGVETVNVETSANTTAVRLYHELDGIRWSVHASVSRPVAGDRLGGAQVDWHRDNRGRKNGVGTVTVDELAAGLARMGIAEVVPARATGGAA